jgi:dolichol-phosphate mannosyltransferase
MAQTYYRRTPRPAPALLSIVVPIFNEEDALPYLIPRLQGLMASLPVPTEIIFVNDGSSDHSLDFLAELSAVDPRFQILALARNFGHQIAATAGLDHAKGDAVVLMDADLQDPPELIHEMIVKYQEGYEVVYAQRIGRAGESAFKRFTAWVFYRLMRALIHKDLPVDTGDFRLISRQCLEALKSMRELHRFIRGMVTWVGFAQIAVPYKRQARVAGSTKYPFRKMLMLAWNAALSFSPLPLRISLWLGFLLTGIGAAYGVYALGREMLGFYVVPGWTSSIVVSCLIGGAVMISIGIQGEYVGRLFEEIKARPLYVLGATPAVRTVEEQSACEDSRKTIDDHNPRHPAHDLVESGRS